MQLYSGITELLAHLKDFIMIGDRKHDIIGANNTGIHSIGVTYGYGSHDELIQYKPTYIVNDVDAIREKLFNRGTDTIAQ
jgi:phosphoglycolate phosphatase